MRSRSDGFSVARRESQYGNNYLYTGREWNARTRLYDYRHRTYDPYTGTFLSIDPIGAWGDGANLGNGYAYVGASPWRWVDPFGLCRVIYDGPKSHSSGKGFVCSSHLNTRACGEYGAWVSSLPPPYHVDPILLQLQRQQNRQWAADAAQFGSDVASIFYEPIDWARGGGATLGHLSEGDFGNAGMEAFTSFVPFLPKRFVEGIIGIGRRGGLDGSLLRIAEAGDGPSAGKPTLEFAPPKKDPLVAGSNPADAVCEAIDGKKSSTVKRGSQKYPDADQSAPTSILEGVRRPSKRKGLVDRVFDAAMSGGVVRDPNTREIIDWVRGTSRLGKWDLGHIRGREYRRLRERLRSGEITYKEFLDEFNNPGNYRPEKCGPNRGHQYEMP